MSNSLGGIAAQTTFLALADLTYRRANLEHAAASLPNLLQSLGLITLVALVFVASAGPEVTVLGVHPVTLLLPLVYVYWLRLTRDVATRPMWEALVTPETREDMPDDDGGDERPLALMWGEFAVSPRSSPAPASSWGGPGCRWPGPRACRRASWARCSPRSSRRCPSS